MSHEITVDVKDIHNKTCQTGTECSKI